MKGASKSRRAFVRVDVNLPTNDKIVSIDDPRAGWLYVVGICIAGRNLSDGHLQPRAAEREANVSTKWTRELIRVGLWHEEGHDCPRCPQPAPARVYIHDYLEEQRSKAEADRDRESGRRGANARWGADRNADRIPNANADRIADGSADPNAHPNTEVEVEVEEVPKHLLTLISRLAARNAHEPPPAETIAAWQEIAGPHVDLVAEAVGYLARFGDRPARDERGAWLGWLREAANRWAAEHPTQPPALGCDACTGGWAGVDAQERPIPCPTCRPRLAVVRPVLAVVQ